MASWAGGEEEASGAENNSSCAVSLRSSSVRNNNNNTLARWPLSKYANLIISKKPGVLNVAGTWQERIAGAGEQHDMWIQITQVRLYADACAFFLSFAFVWAFVLTDSSSFWFSLLTTASLHSNSSRRCFTRVLLPVGRPRRVACHPKRSQHALHHYQQQGKASNIRRCCFFLCVFK